MSFMKSFIALFCFVLVLLTAGCSTGPGSLPRVSQASAVQQTDSGADSEPQDQVSEGVKAMCSEQIYALATDGTLFNTWQGEPAYGGCVPVYSDFELTAFSRDGDQITVTVDLYGVINLDPVTLEETTGYGTVSIMAQDVPNAPSLAFGRSVVQLQETAQGLNPVACTYERHPHAGLDYLKKRTEQLAPELAKQEKPDLSKYDPALVDFVRRRLFSSRYVEKPEDITLNDLTQYTGSLELYYGSLGTGDDMAEGYRLDASFLSLLPNLEAFDTGYRLKDYGVFEKMTQLKKLTLSNMDDEAARTLKIGHTDELVLYDPDLELLDLRSASVDRLRLFSWSTAVGGFAGCENVKKLYIMSTRTDMRLINAQAFPGITYLNMYFYSDTPRVRDFSQLVSFEGVKIDIGLEYQACNNQTLQSLKGIPLNDVYLNPTNGANPLSDYDSALADALTAQSVSSTMDQYFQERTGD